MFPRITCRNCKLSGAFLVSRTTRRTFYFDLISEVKIILTLLLNQNIDLVQDIVPGIGETYYNLMKIFESMQDTIPSVALLSYIRTLNVCHLI